MQSHLLMFFFGVVCAGIVFAASDAVDWTRFKAWCSVVFETISSRAKALWAKIRARMK